jgi:hypothetical protein
LDKEEEGRGGMKGRKVSATPSVVGGEESVVEGEDGEGVDDKTVVEKSIMEGEGDGRKGEGKESEEDEEDTILALQAQVKREEKSSERDELVEELLSDVEMSGM